MSKPIVDAYYNIFSDWLKIDNQYWIKKNAAVPWMELQFGDHPDGRLIMHPATFVVHGSRMKVGEVEYCRSTLQLPLKNENTNVIGAVCIVYTLNDLLLIRFPHIRLDCLIWPQFLIYLALTLPTGSLCHFLAFIFLPKDLRTD